MPLTEQATLTRPCQHCGSDFVPRRDDEIFCCGGCRVVHDLIQGEGFSFFYQLLGRKTLEPPDSLPMSSVESDQIAEEIERAESTARENDSPARLGLRVGNLSCTACIWLIDHLFQKYEGGLKLPPTRQGQPSLCGGNRGASMR